VELINLILLSETMLTETMPMLMEPMSLMESMEVMPKNNPLTNHKCITGNHYIFS
jgi:hypothetical protein